MSTETAALATAETATETAKSEPKTRPPAAYAYDPCAPLPIEASTEALTILAKARGQAALAELDQAGKVLAGEIRFKHRAMTTAGSIREHLPAFQDLTVRARVYGARAVALARISGKTKAPALAAIPEIPDLAIILSRSIEGQDFRGQLAAAAAGAKSELGRVEQELADLIEAAGHDERYRQIGDEPWRVTQDRKLLALAVETRAQLARLQHDDQLARTPPKGHEFEVDAKRLVSEVGRIPMAARAAAPWSQDAFLEAITSKLAARKALAAKLGALESDRGKTQAVVAERVGRAVEAAGGPKNVIGAIVVAEILANSLPLALMPFVNTVRTLESAHARISDDWSRLTLALGDACNPPAAQTLRAQQAQTAEQLTVVRADLLSHHRAIVIAELDQAVAGDEVSRASIERLTGLCPDAFPAGFAAAIAGARFEAAAAAELAGALLRSPA